MTETDRNILRTTAFVLVLIAVLANIMQAENLPDAPHLKMRTTQVTDDPFLGENNLVHNGTSTIPKVRTVDWKFLAMHGMYLGSIGFDVYATNRGLNSSCGYVEGGAYGAKTTGDIARNNLIEFAIVTTVDYALKRWSRAPNTFYATTGVAAAKHIHGGGQWVNHCF